MQIASNNLEFEKAAALRDKIEAIKTTLEKQSIDNLNTGSKDIISFNFTKDTWYFAVLIMRDGKLNDTFYYEFKNRITDNKEALATFISQYYLNDEADFLPDEIITATEIDDIEIISQIMQEKNLKTKIKTVKTGHNFRLCTIAENNLLQEIKIRQQEKEISPLLELKEKLKLNNIPQTVECMDISNISGTDAVAAVVCFKNAKPYKSNYRKYKIKTVKDISDYHMMAEALYRHLKRKLKENSLPDILMLDGGKGHLNTALEVLKELKCNLNIIAIAKERENKTSGEKIYIPGRQNKINFKNGSAALKMLTVIRDETHRFAITFHKNLRDKKITQSSLDNISGIGKSKKMALLQQFGSTANLQKASVEEIASVKGITPNLAKIIKENL